MAATKTDSSALTPKQQRAVRALLEHKSVGEAAQSIGVGERTLFRWLTDPAFKVALSAAESDLLDAATRRLLTLQDRAIGTFESLLADDSAASDTVRLRAASAVLDYLLKLRELRDIEQRLTALEQAMAAQAQAPGWLS